MKPWGRIPTWWYRDENGLDRLRGGSAASDSQAALRVYLAAAAIERPADTFEITASLSALEDATDLSRPTVVRGLRVAESHGLIRLQRGGPTSTSVISLVCPEAEEGRPGGWAKLPRPEVLRRIPRVSRRGAAGLVALKVYATLVAARPNDSAVAQLRHVTLREKTGAQAVDIRRAITILGNEGLVEVNQEDPALRWEADNPRAKTAQRYRIAGRLDAPKGRLSLSTADHGESAV